MSSPPHNPHVRTSVHTYQLSFALAARRRALRVPIHRRELLDAVPECRKGAELRRTGQMLALGRADWQRQVAVLIAYSDVWVGFTVRHEQRNAFPEKALTAVRRSIRLSEWGKDVLP